MDDARYQADAWNLLSQATPRADGPVTLRAAGTVCAHHLGVDAMGVTLISAGELRVLACATDEDAHRLENIQLVTGEGPCTEAFLRQQIVAVDDLHGAFDRWPVFAPEATQLGIRSVVALPLSVGRTCVGAMDVYLRRPDALTDEQRARSRAWARILTLMAIDEHPQILHVEAGAARPGPQGYPPAVHQAAGILAVKDGSTPDEALVRLRAHAYAHAIPLGEAAQQVIEGRHEPEGPDTH
ncbi:GAF and ANTAR domain-containing protein [Streptomyces sp. NPDC102406]|uniref:GAF and ANTAR domain-containing protein n=1 Tax=Streptomyces sp. NPDC102406 TaxID=3366171 RepID=UPI00382D8271